MGVICLSKAESGSRGFERVFIVTEEIQLGGCTPAVCGWDSSVDIEGLGLGDSTLGQRGIWTGEFTLVERRHHR